MTRSRAKLRLEAEAQIRSAPEVQAPDGAPREVLHELDVLEAELRLQNEELRRTQLALQESLKRYRDLYEFAPVAYLTLSGDATILEVNLTGCRLLGADRKQILHHRLSRFVAPEDADKCHRLFRNATRMTEHQAITLGIRRADGAFLHVQLDCISISQEGERVRLRATLTDITERVRAEAEIEHLAYYDSLTKLPNRRLLNDRWRNALAGSARTQEYGAALLIDLDDFKALNDTLGHECGDLMLQEVADRLRKSVRAQDTVARLGGDEFVVILQELGKDAEAAAAGARAAANKLLSAIHGRYILAGCDCHSSGSVGIALFYGHRESVSDLHRRADLALYRAKEAGSSRLRFFEPGMQVAVANRAHLEADLRRGLAAREFTFHFQPQVDGEGTMIGAEVLARWQHPGRGLLSSAEFVPLAEEKGLIGIVDRQALAAACAQLKKWGAHPGTEHLTLAVNVSSYQFNQPDFVEHTRDTIGSSGVSPEKIVLEITERGTIASLREAERRMHALKALGVKLSLDDFGIGYSSISYLRELPLDQLKIDLSFVKGILANPKDEAITRSIIELGSRLGLVVIAEGIETEEQRGFLAGLGCNAFQGFLFGRALPAEELLNGARKALAGFSFGVA
jgi:diguanylate cyclase (GGDEF)-like protein/PAS domain S-box-containing protein